jgi:thiol-disulfide isomerase/thioredoxin
VLALGFGLYRALTDGRFRGTRRLPALGPTPDPTRDTAPDDTAWTALGDARGTAGLGTRATLVQFSSAFCAPCRTTRHILGEVAGSVPGVVHLELDAEQHLDVVRRLGVMRTPTTLVLDAGGREVARASGAPRRDQVLAALP